MNARATVLVPSTPSRELYRDLYLPPLIARAGGRSSLRFLEYFKVNVRNHKTRAAYARPR